MIVLIAATVFCFLALFAFQHSKKAGSKSVLFVSGGVVLIALTSALLTQTYGTTKAVFMVLGMLSICGVLLVMVSGYRQIP